MSPAAIEDVPSRREAWKTLSEPKIYPVREAKFENYVPPQIDGREKALAQPEGTTAIVIDTGKIGFRHLMEVVADHDQLRPSRFLHSPSRMVFRIHASTLPSTDHGQVPRPKVGQNFLLRRPRLLFGHHGAWPHKECIRGRDWHCQQLGRRGACSRLHFPQTWHKRRGRRD